jgi:hypothetical protein
MHVTKSLELIILLAASGGLLCACGNSSASLPPSDVQPPTIVVGRINQMNSSFAADLTLFNSNAFPIGSVEISCATLSADGLDLSNYRFAIFDVIPARDSKVFSKYKIGIWPREGRSVVCESIKATPG